MDPSEHPGKPSQERSLYRISYKSVWNALLGDHKTSQGEFQISKAELSPYLRTFLKNLQHRHKTEAAFLWGAQYANECAVVPQKSQLNVTSEENHL